MKKQKPSSGPHLKHPPSGPEFRLKFVTQDGSVVMNRQSDGSFYIMPWGVDQEFVDYVLKREALEHGVKVVSYTLDKTGLNATVEWL